MGWRILTHWGGGGVFWRIVLFYYLHKKITRADWKYCMFLTIQKPGHQSSVFFQRNVEIKLTTLISTSFWPQKNRQSAYNIWGGGHFLRFWEGAFPTTSSNIIQNYVRIFGIWVLEPKVSVRNAPIIQPGILVHFCPKWGCIGLSLCFLLNQRSGHNVWRINQCICGWTKNPNNWPKNEISAPETSRILKVQKMVSKRLNGYYLRSYEQF